MNRFLSLLLISLIIFSQEIQISRKESDLWNYYVVAEFNKEGLASLMAILKYVSGVESIFIDSASKYSQKCTAEEYVKKVNSGEYNDFATDNVCFGLAAWCDSENKHKLFDLCQNNIGDFDCQMRYLLKDLKSTINHGIWFSMTALKDIETTTNRIITEYLVNNAFYAKTINSSTKLKIIQYAKDYFKELSTGKYDTLNTKNLYEFNSKYYTYLRYDSDSLLVQFQDLKEEGLISLAQLRFKELVKIKLSKNSITTLSPLKNSTVLSNVKEFTIEYNPITSVKEISNILTPTLEILSLVDNSFINLQGISELSFNELKTLNINWNSIINLDDFKSLLIPSLTTLNLDHNLKLLDFNGLKYAYLPLLQNLELSYNQLTNLNWMNGFMAQSLKAIRIKNNKLNDISGLQYSHIPSLTELELPGNEITDLSVFNILSLSQLKTINLYNNKLDNIKGINSKSLPNLENLIVTSNNLYSLNELSYQRFNELFWLIAMNNHIESLEFLTTASLPKLNRINLDNNNISSLKELKNADLSKLEYLYLNNNQLTDLDGLDGVSLPKLKVFYIMGNKIKDIDGLLFADLPELVEIDIRNNGLDANSADVRTVVEEFESRNVKISV